MIDFLVKMQFGLNKKVLPVHVPVHEEESRQYPVECASSLQGQG
jgi:hypothetical protein